MNLYPERSSTDSSSSSSSSFSTSSIDTSTTSSSINIENNKSGGETSNNNIKVLSDKSNINLSSNFKSSTKNSFPTIRKFSLSQRRKSDSATSKSKIQNKSLKRPISLVTNKTTITTAESSTMESNNNKRSTKINLFSSKKKPLVLAEQSLLQQISDSSPSSSSSSSPSSPSPSSNELTSQSSSDPTIRASTLSNPDTTSTTETTTETTSNSNMGITTFLAAPRLTQRVRLSSGRVVSFSEVGDRNGFPVFVFLGMGCVRYFIAFFDDLAKSYNLRLICPDRPGIGLSDDVKAEDQQVLKWPDVIEELCKLMEIPKFFIMAHSAGAPYALACAMKIPQRLQGTIYLVSPWVSTTVANNFKWLQYVPTPIIKLTSSAGISIQQMKHGKQPYSIKPQSQRNSGALASPSNNEKKQQLGLAILKASFAENLAGTNNDLLMCFERKHTFGFSYTDVNHPVHVFHGTKDERIPTSAVEWMEGNMSDCKLTLIEGGKHSLFLRAEVVDSIFKSIAMELHDKRSCRLCKIFSRCWLLEEAKERELEIQRKLVENYKNVNRKQTVNMMKTGTSNIVLDHQHPTTGNNMSQNPVYTYF